MAHDPIFAPAFRFALSRIVSDDSLKPDQRQQQVDDLVATARKRGEPALAKELLGSALLTNAEISKNSGDVAAAQELADAARTALGEAQKMGDHSPDVRMKAADAELLLSDSATYERLMWKLVGDRPDDDEAYDTLFRYYQSHGQAERSVAVSQSWLLADPNYPPARLLRALLLSKAGVTDEAERMLGDLYKERPDDSEVLDTMRAVLSEDHGSSDQFVGILEARLAGHPDDLAAADQLLTEYVRQNRTADALHLIETARTAVSDDADLLYFTAHLYDKLGAKDSQVEATIKTLEMALKLDPESAAANNDLGYTFADQGKHLAESEAMIRRAVVAEPDNAAYLDSLGWVLYKRGHFAEARPYLEKAIEPQSHADPVVLNHLGDDLYRLSANVDAQRRWQMAADRLDQQLKERAAANELPDAELDALQGELTEKLKQVGQGGPVNVAPVVDSEMKQAQR
jgi:tetratricopeptide (TPR) repeat protein